MKLLLSVVLIALLSVSQSLAQQPAAPAQEPLTRAQLEAASPEERQQLISQALGTLVTGGRVQGVRWSEDGTSVSFMSDGAAFEFDLNARELRAVVWPERGQGGDGERFRRGGRGQGQGRGDVPARGRQRLRETSPDGKWVAISSEWNVIIQPAEVNFAAGADSSGSNTGNAEASGPQAPQSSAPEPIKVTTDGHRKFRYGEASWVYGEELDQRDAMWWSPDSSKLVFYEFDERQVPDHFITAGLTDLHTKVLTEGYPKPGEPNPIANLVIYDLATKELTRVDALNEGEWYTYNVLFTPDGSELLFSRTNRRQDTLHVMAANLETGAARIVVTEIQPTWQENRPAMRFLADGKRFIWETEKSGWKQYELRDLEGRFINTLTQGNYPVNSIEKIDEAGAAGGGGGGVLFYTAYSDANPLNLQLHRVNLDGSGQKRLTPEPLSHSVQMSPDSKWFITTHESIDAPPTSALYDVEGNRIATLTESDASTFEALALPMPELFEFKADDGTTTLYGVLYKPALFDESQKYPLVIDVYGGPLSQGLRNRFTPVNPVCENGFLIAKLENRGTVARGKAFESAAYLKLGDVDMADQAAGVKHLRARSYVNGDRVGIAGHSYGGYMAALAVLKYPDVFYAGVAGAPVTDWRNYDTIYTERFMRTPQENAEGYEKGSCLNYIDQFTGKLLILHGMVDDNVHPNNAFQLMDKLQRAGKRFEVMFWPNAGHGLGTGSGDLRWEFLRRNLLDQPSMN